MPKQTDIITAPSLLYPIIIIITGGGVKPHLLENVTWWRLLRAKREELASISSHDFFSFPIFLCFMDSRSSATPWASASSSHSPCSQVPFFFFFFRNFPFRDTPKYVRNFVFPTYILANDLWPMGERQQVASWMH